MLEEHFWNLFAKKLTGEATARELKELEGLMRTYPELGYAAESIEEVWALKQAPDTAAAHEAFEAHMARLHTLQLTRHWEEEMLPPPPRNRRMRMMVFAAAILLTLAGASWWLVRQGPVAPERLQAQAQVRQVQTTPGTKSRIVLPDSSVVWLNSGSRIAYNEAFGHSNRHLTLTGEAFFDVRKSTMPFIIKTADIQIKVLGTAFNVRSYPSERKTETSLIHGRVEITWA
jgi:transmembrane sensor